MKFTVVIAAFREDTVGCAIASIARQTWTDWELVVVTQGDRERTRAVAARFAEREPRIRSLHIADAGTSRARNAGIAAGSGDVVALIDDDCEARADWLEVMAEYLGAHPEVGLVGGSVVAPPALQRGISVCPEVILSESVYDSRATPHRPPAGWDWIGCNVGIRRQTIEASGAFDAYLGPGTDFPAGEDTDYKLRLEALGVPMGASPRLVVNHTYGRRYGLRAALRNSRNYAYGNGGLAGKLTLLGDPRGREWLDETRHECLTAWLTRPARLPKDLNRLRNYVGAYRLCCHRYRAKGGMLEPLQPARASGSVRPRRG